MSHLGHGLLGGHVQARPPLVRRDLRARVDAYNAEHGRPSDAVRVLYYCGQTVVDDDPHLGQTDATSEDET